MRLPFVYLCSLLVVAILPWTSAKASLVTGPWDVATTDPPNGQGNGPILNANTSAPIIGDGTANSADGEMFDSPFPALTLAAAGDKIVFMGTIRIVGSANSPATSGNPRTQFRFGLFDGDEDGLDDNGWTGYYMSNRHGNSGTPAGTLAEKPTGNTSIYLSTTGQTPLATVQGDGTSASLFHDGTYALNLTIERNPSSQLIVSATINGSNGFSQSLSATDTTPSTFTFDHLGFLLGGNLDVDQAFLSDIQVSLNPVPEGTGFLLVGFVAIMVGAVNCKRGIKK